MILFDVPVDPDAPEARQWLLDELAKPPYQAARPTWFDRVSKAFLDWLDGLFSGGGDGSPVLAIVLVAIVAAAVIAALLVYGVPRRNRRARPVGGLFSDADVRSADELRRSAEAAASAGDWSAAIQERFRALARMLDDRAVLTLHPGTTATALARAAATAFPASADALAAAARSFDGVRYLGEPGSRAEYETVVALDADVAAARPLAVV